MARKRQREHLTGDVLEAVLGLATSWDMPYLIWSYRSDCKRVDLSNSESSAGEERRSSKLGEHVD